IAHNGVVFPCNMFNPESLGNIMNKNIKKIWFSEEHLNFIQQHKNHPYCKNCQYMIPNEEKREE
ncbi:MAG: SPASM domain-containing protein, partial [Promethearchaeota archaeon]